MQMTKGDSSITFLTIYYGKGSVGSPRSAYRSATNCMVLFSTRSFHPHSTTSKFIFRIALWHNEWRAIHTAKSIRFGHGCALDRQLFFEFLKSNSDTPSKGEVSGKNKSCKVSREWINIKCCLIASKLYSVWR